jgi:hypothetical protein
MDKVDSKNLLLMKKKAITDTVQLLNGQEIKVLEQRITKLMVESI